jgi:hypothetical protein
MMDDAEAVRLCMRIWGGKAARNLSCPQAGGDATWEEVIAVAEETIEAVLRLHMRSPIQGKRAEIERRCALDNVARRASLYPGSYATPLYVTEGFLGLAASDDVEALAAGGRRRILKEPPHCREHVVPVAVHGSGQRILEDPDANLPKIRRTFLSPICLITRDEDDLVRRSSVKRHDAPFHPFSRYAGVAVVRRTDTGSAIDPYAFTFRDHLELMRMHPAYASGVPLFHGGAATWRARLAAIRADAR